MIKIPNNKPIGKVLYTVESRLDPITFTRRKDAYLLKSLLNDSASNIQAEVIRREVTTEGYIPTYGDEHVKEN